MPRDVSAGFGTLRASHIGVGVVDEVPGRIYAVCVRCGLRRMVRKDRAIPELCASCKSVEPHWGRAVSK